MHGAPPALVPIVLVTLNYQLNGHVPRSSIPFMCKRNAKVVVLTNVVQRKLPAADCLEVINVNATYVASVSEMPWPNGPVPKIQKLFFDRWYILRDWMRSSSTHRVFTIDSDALVTLNVSDFASSNQEVKKHDLLISYVPPRVTGAFALLTERALSNITAFWNRMLQPDIWTSNFVNHHAPNDMIAFGHYIHMAVGRPYPCWGLGPGREAGSCDNSMDYGHTQVLERLEAFGVHAAYPPATLTLNQHGVAPFSAGVVDISHTHDPHQRFKMRAGSKKLRFLRGVPQLQLQSEEWVDVWAYILEDETERCIDGHVQRINNLSTCACSSWCCGSCV